MFFALFNIGNFEARKSILWLTVYTISETVTFTATVMTYFSKQVNQTFKLMMYFPACLIVIRLQLYILHSVIFFYHFNETQSKEEQEKMRQPEVHSWFVLLV